MACFSHTVSCKRQEIISFFHYQVLPYFWIFKKVNCYTLLQVCVTYIVCTLTELYAFISFLALQVIRPYFRVHISLDDSTVGSLQYASAVYAVSKDIFLKYTAFNVRYSLGIIDRSNQES